MSFVSDPGGLCLLPLSMILWWANLLGRKEVSLRPFIDLILFPFVLEMRPDQQ